MSRRSGINLHHFSVLFASNSIPTKYKIEFRIQSFICFYRVWDYISVAILQQANCDGGNYRRIQLQTLKSISCMNLFGQELQVFYAIFISIARAHSRESIVHAECKPTSQDMTSSCLRPFPPLTLVGATDGTADTEILQCNSALQYQLLVAKTSMQKCECCIIC